QEKKRMQDKAFDIERLIKGSLRHEGDDVISNDGRILIVMIGCARPDLARVLSRFRGMINNYLDDRKLEDVIDVSYVCATYPDDAQNGIELIEKAQPCRI
ncbi:MAG: hypothetical protein PHP46_06735, partial [Candidatus Omnitrophica bacterium]|nr:hypothetical protein [Candidatus Omnitrophota bacterium]